MHYDGQIRFNGTEYEAHGEGVLYWDTALSEDGIRIKYKGGFRAGRPHGLGAVTNKRGTLTADIEAIEGRVHEEGTRKASQRVVERHRITVRGFHGGASCACCGGSYFLHQVGAAECERFRLNVAQTVIRHGLAIDTDVAPGPSQGDRPPCRVVKPKPQRSTVFPQRNDSRFQRPKPRWRPACRQKLKTRFPLRGALQ